VFLPLLIVKGAGGANHRPRVRPDGVDGRDVSNVLVAAVSPRARLERQYREKRTMEHGIIAWIIIGAIAGWLAGKIVDGTGLGLIMDIVVGVVGAFIGGYLANLTGVVIGSGFVASIIIAIIGAVILLLVVKLVKKAL
jgi:uncharacterized membrane protein YeaQ/YmgE (transglycosylase-associated protein family)